MENCEYMVIVYKNASKFNTLLWEIAGTPGHTIRFQGTLSWDIPQNTMGCFRNTADEVRGHICPVKLRLADDPLTKE